MTIGIVGLGYVGLPLAVAFAEAGERVIGVDTSVAKVASIRRGESYIEDIPSEQLAAVRSQLEATTRTSRLALADAIIICVPTPLTPNREPDLGPLLAAAQRVSRRPAGRPARRPRVDDLPGHDARAPAADPRGDRPAGRRRLPPRLLARARRSRHQDHHLRQHAEDHRRAHPRLRGQGRGLYGRVCESIVPVTHPRGGRDGEAAREHLPLGQHRVGQRARDARRPHGHRHLRGDRRGRDQAVRLHALRAGPRHGWPLPPGRPLLPLLEGTRARLLHRVHRARRQGQPAHAVLLRREASSAPSTTRARPSAARRSRSSAWPTSPPSATSASRPA